MEDHKICRWCNDLIDNHKDWGSQACIMMAMDEFDRLKEENKQLVDKIYQHKYVLRTIKWKVDKELTDSHI